MTTKNVFGVAVNLNAQADHKPAPELAARLRDDLAQQLRTVPGVVSVSQLYRQPLSGQMGNLLVSLGTNAGERLVESRFNFCLSRLLQHRVSPDSAGTCVYG